MAKMNLVREFTKGIIKENPVLRLVLGCCATLAVTTAASNAIGMGAATTFVLVCSNGVISLLRKVIPDKVRIPGVHHHRGGVRHHRTAVHPGLLPRPGRRPGGASCP